MVVTISQVTTQRAMSKMPSTNSMVIWGLWDTAGLLGLGVMRDASKYIPSVKR